MPSLPLTRRWNFSMFTFFPSFFEGEHMHLAALYSILILAPTALAMIVALWPLKLMPDTNNVVVNNNRSSNGNYSSGSTSTTTVYVSHSSYAVFQLIYSTLGFVAVSFNAIATVPGIPWSWFVATYVVGQGIAQGTLWVFFAIDPLTVHSIVGMNILTACIFSLICVFAYLRLEPGPYRSRVVGEDSWYTKIHEEVAGGDADGNPTSTGGGTTTGEALLLSSRGSLHRRSGALLCRKKMQDLEKEVMRQPLLEKSATQQQQVEQQRQEQPQQPSSVYSTPKSSEKQLDSSRTIQTDNTTTTTTANDSDTHTNNAVENTTSSSSNHNGSLARSEEEMKVTSSTLLRGGNNGEENGARDGAPGEKQNDDDHDARDGDGHDDASVLGESFSHMMSTAARLLSDEDHVNAKLVTELDDGTTTSAVDRAFVMLLEWSESRWCHVIVAAICTLIIAGVFTFCQMFTTAFFQTRPSNHTLLVHPPSSSSSSTNGAAAATTTNGFHQILLFVVFALTCEVLLALLRLAGRIADMCKWSRGPSAEVIFEIAMSAFYNVFYRSLFQHVGETRTLIVLVVAHLLQNIFIYPFRLTRFYFDLSSRVQEKMLAIPFIGSAMYDPSSLIIWRVRLNLDMMIRFVTSQSATVAYILIMTFLRYGFNGEYYSFLGADLSDEQYKRTVIFLSINVAAEIIMFAVIHIFFMDLARPLARLVKFEVLYLVYLVVMVAHVETDVFLARCLITFPPA